MDHIGPDTGQWCWRDLFEFLHRHEGSQWTLLTGFLNRHRETVVRKWP
jgi:hypothetical protein